MPQAGEGAVHIWPFSKRKQLMKPDIRQPLRVGPQGVEDSERLGVEHTDDDIVSFVDVL